MTKLLSYVVRYDSGFAPNPFFGYSTLATCKPDIRKSVKVGDWVVGTGSAARDVNRGDHLVHAMRVTETIDFRHYWTDERFKRKRPMRQGSRRQSCGDNIYYRSDDDCHWLQLPSFHAHPVEAIRQKHINRDTSVDRVLVSNEFYYFGGEGPMLPDEFRVQGARSIVKRFSGMKRIDDANLILDFAAWLRTLDDTGYCGRPRDWVLEDG
ncbi:MAG: hypothetical protein ABJP70_01175 [Erythrobacter sp.]|uniref:Nmad2 family putative nucleotide modification protein n=1 Tax=Parasphingorhabdus sp. TaxID=2709688 RepID=UPI00326D583B